MAQASAQTVVKMEQEGNVFKVPCKINGLTLSFIFDTGASDVSISLSEAIFMLKNGYLTAEEISGSQNYQTATGEIHEGMTLTLREIEFQNIKLYNVPATVILEMKAPLLFGQSAMKKLGAFQFDPNTGTLTILNNSKNYNFSSNNCSEINPLKGQVYTKKELYDIAFPYFKIGDYQKAADSFSLYLKIYPDDPFGYYMVGKCLWGIDSTMKRGIANFYFNKTIEIYESLSNNSKYKPQFLGSCKYFVAYYANVVKDKKNAIYFLEKIIHIDPNDNDAIKNLQMIKSSF